MPANEPITIAGALVLWCSVGTLLAVVLSRRGRQARTISPLGVVLAIGDDRAQAELRRADGRQSVAVTARPAPEEAR